MDSSDGEDYSKHEDVRISTLYVEGEKGKRDWRSSLFVIIGSATACLFNVLIIAEVIVTVVERR